MGYPQLVLVTRPAVEPLSLAEAKEHLRLSCGALTDELTPEQSIPPGAHAVAAAYSLVGTAIDVLGYRVLVEFAAGACGSGGSIAVKLQHSDDNLTFSDVTSGAFTTVTEANDNATYEEEYTGGKRYLRAVATVAGVTCSFGVTVIKKDPSAAEDDSINGWIMAARQFWEGFQNRAYITQIWEAWLDEFSDEDFIALPMPPLASISSIKYYDTSDIEYVIYDSVSETKIGLTDYFIDTKSTPGRVCLPYGKTWPSVTLRPHNGICIAFVAGYGVTAALFKANCPFSWKVLAAMKLSIGDLYENREAQSQIELKENKAAYALMWPDRVF